MLYNDARPLVRNGDVVFFSSHKGVGDWVIKRWENRVVKGIASGIFSHTGTAYWLENRLFLLEASFSGGVRMVPMSQRQPDKIAQMNFIWNSASGDVAFENMGKKYGLWDAFAAGLGWRESQENEFICTEYVADICVPLGYNFPKTRQLPDVFFNQVVNDGFQILTVDNPLKLIN